MTKRFVSIIKKKIKDSRILYKVEWSNGSVSYEPLLEMDHELLKKVQAWEIEQYKNPEDYDDENEKKKKFKISEQRQQEVRHLEQSVSLQKEQFVKQAKQQQQQQNNQKKINSRSKNFEKQINSDEEQENEEIIIVKKSKKVNISDEDDAGDNDDDDKTQLQSKKQLKSKKIKDKINIVDKRIVTSDRKSSMSPIRINENDNHQELNKIKSSSIKVSLVKSGAKNNVATFDNITSIERDKSPYEGSNHSIQEKIKFNKKSQDTEISKKKVAPSVTQQENHTTKNNNKNKQSDNEEQQQLDKQRLKDKDHNKSHKDKIKDKQKDITKEKANDDQVLRDNERNKEKEYKDKEKLKFNDKNKEKIRDADKEKEDKHNKERKSYIDDEIDRSRGKELEKNKSNYDQQDQNLTNEEQDKDENSNAKQPQNNLRMATRRSKVGPNEPNLQDLSKTKRKRRFICTKASKNIDQGDAENDKKEEDENKKDSDALINADNENDHEERKNHHQPKQSVPCQILQARKQEDHQMLEFLVKYDNSTKPSWIQQQEVRNKSPRALSEYLLGRISWNQPGTSLAK